MCDELDTVSLEELALIIGGAEVDTRLRGQWIDKRLENLVKPAPTTNPNGTENVVPIR